MCAIAPKQLRGAETCYLASASKVAASVWFGLKIKFCVYAKKSEAIFAPGHIQRSALMLVE